MCDITQFFVIVHIYGCTSTTIAQHFIQDVLMKFGLCHLVVIHNGTLFKIIFSVMRDYLTINCEFVDKRNHKDISAERLHRFLNKSVIIASNDRDTVSTFVETDITAAYAWKSTNIEGTNIIRSILAIGRGLCFPLDININNLPILSQIK